MSHFNRNTPVEQYLTKRAELGRLHTNDRVVKDKLWADAELRGKMGCRAANEVIAAIDNLRARGYR